MRTIEWPEQEVFLQQLDLLKKRNKIRHDSALAELAGISHSSISNWRNGKQRPSATAITRIAGAVEEPARPLLAVAGLIEGQADDVDPLADLPESLRRLIAVYRNADDATRTRLGAALDILLYGAEGPGADLESKRNAVRGRREPAS